MRSQIGRQIIFREVLYQIGSSKPWFSILENFKGGGGGVKNTTYICFLARWLQA